MWMSIVWSFIVAYASAVLFYQTANIREHPQQSIAWILVITLSLTAVIMIFRYNQRGIGEKNAITNT